MKKIKYIIIFIICIFIFSSANIVEAKADNLSDSLDTQLEHIDLSLLQEYLDGLQNTPINSFSLVVKNILSGDFNSSFSNFGSYVSSIFLSNLKSILPIFITIIAISVIFKILSTSKGGANSEQITNVINLVHYLSLILLLSTSFVSIFMSCKNTIENLSKLNEIMSPIIITLMVASGGSVSASIYKPVVSFLSSGIIKIILYLIFPLVGVITILFFISKLSKDVKIVKFAEFFTSFIKWILGIAITVFSIFLSIQGLSSATFDGISIKAVKYAISNSIPLVGGFLKDGFDLMVAGSVLIKNSIGIGVVLLVIFTIISPIIYMIIYSLVLKLVASITDLLGNNETAEICVNLSKSVTYLISSILMVGFMIFITILLMIMSANAFI